MNYEFHVGDYVETVGGFVGWISDIQDNNYIVITNDNNVRCGYYLPQEDRYFARIGAYDFTKKEKKKIEQLEKDLPIEMKVGDKVAIMKQYVDGNYNTIIYSTKMIDKINELVDAVNRLGKLYTTNGLENESKRF